MLNYLDKMIRDGYGQRVTVGAFSTGVNPGTNILDLDIPALAVAVPPGFVLRPIFCSMQVHGTTIAASDDESEMLLAVDSLGLWTGDGTSTAENVSNMNAKFDKGSAARVGSEFTADMTTTPPPNGQAAADPVLDIELHRSVATAEIVTAVNTYWFQNDFLYQPNYPEWLTGPCTLIAYFGGTVALTGFLQAAWVLSAVNIMNQYADGKILQTLRTDRPKQKRKSKRSNQLMLNYLDRMIRDGYGQRSNVGAFSTGTNPGTDVIDIDQPAIAVGVPANYVLRPIFCSMQVHATTIAADDDEQEMLLAVDSLGLWTGDGTVTNDNPSNLNSKFDSLVTRPV